MQINLITNLCLIQLLQLTRSSKLSTINDLTHNPYKHYDKLEKDWRVVEINKKENEIFYRKHKQKYSEFKSSENIIQLPKTLNNPLYFKSKLSTTLIYFLTNNYNPQQYKKREFKIESPFIIDKKDKEFLQNLQMVQYSPVNIDVKLVMKEEIHSVEILDIIPSTSQILPMICSQSTLLHQSTCTSFSFKTNNPKIPIPLNFKFFPTKVGRNKYKLYLLTRINNNTNTVVTVNGTYTVKKHRYYYFYFSNKLFRIFKHKNNFDYLWIKNYRKRKINIESLMGFGHVLKLNYPKDFYNKKFNALELNSDLRKRLENINQNYWLIPSKDERPIIEIEYKAKDIYRQLNIPIEIAQFKMEANIIRIIIDQTPLLINFPVFLGKDQKIWDHDFLNLGVLSSPYLWHVVPVYVSNKTPLPIYLQNVEIKIDNYDFDVNIATNYKYGIALPLESLQMTLFHLAISYKGDKKFAKVSGYLEATIDVYRSLYIERLDFYAIYYKDIFSITSNIQNNIITYSTTKVNIFVEQNTNSLIKLDNLEIVKDDNFKSIGVKSVSQDVLKPEVEYKIYELDFSRLPKLIKNSKAVYIFKFTVFENVITKKMEFPIKVLFCNNSDSEKENYFDCRNNQQISFPMFNDQKRILQKEFFIQNFNPCKIVIEKIKARDFNIEFEIYLHLRLIPKDKDITETKIRNTYQIKRPLDIILPSISLSLNTRLQLILTIKVPKEYQHKQNVNNFQSYIFIYTKNGMQFRINVEYQFSIGELKFFPNDIIQNILFPYQKTHLVFNTYSTYDQTVSIEVPDASGNGSNMFELITFNRIIKKGENKRQLEYRIDPFQMSYPEETLMSQKNYTDYQICLRDIDKYYTNTILWKKLKERTNLKYQTSIEIKNSINKKILLQISGEIQKGQFYSGEIDLGNIPFYNQTYHDLNLYNPFNVTASFKLYAVPERFLNIDKIDQEIINQIQHKNKQKNNILCIKNEFMPLDTIIYYAHKIYSEKLEFLKGMKPKNQKTENFACFKIPKDDKESEMLFIKITTLTNYFFEFLYERPKNKLLEEKVVVLSDIELYNQNQAVITKKINRQKNILNLFLEFFSTFLLSFKKQEKKKKKFDYNNQDLLQLHHVQNLTDYLAQKELFINPKYVNKTFTINSKQSLQISDAFMINPSNQTNTNHSMLLLLKNNITYLEKNVIKYRKVHSKLKIYSQRNHPISKNTLIFKIFENKKRILKTEKGIQFKGVIKTSFIFENSGDSELNLQKITIGKDPIVRQYIKVLDFYPVKLLPKKSIKIIFVFLITKKHLSNFTVPIFVQTKYLNYEFKLKIVFLNFFVQNLKNVDFEKKCFSFFIYFLIFIIFIGFIKIIARITFQLTITFTNKIKPPRFINNSTLEEKLKIHKAELYLTKFEIINKKLNNETYSLMNKKHSEFDLDKLNSSNSLIQRLFQNEDILNKYDYTKNIFSQSFVSDKFDNSQISIEQFFKLLNSSKISSDSNDESIAKERKRILNNSVIYNDEDDDEQNFNENLGLMNNCSLSEFQKSVNQDISINKQEYTLNNQNQSTSNFLNSLLLEHKLEKSESQKSKSEILEDKEEKKEDVTSFKKLDEAFGMFPFYHPKESQYRHFNLLSRQDYPNSRNQQTSVEKEDSSNKKQYNKY